MASTPPFGNSNSGYPTQGYHVSQQQTMPSPAVSFPLAPPITPGMPLPFAPPLPLPLPPDDTFTLLAKPVRKRRFTRLIPTLIAFILLVAIIAIWLTPLNIGNAAVSTKVTQQNFGNTSNTATTNNTSSSGSIHVYIVGAVKNPGVYTLAADARVYDLVQAAGGPQPKADLVALNLAATLTDGEEVYVTLVGEIPPTYMGGVPGPGSSGTPTGNTSSGQLININTATVDEMRQSLHVSSTTAQNIVNYRVQHGPFTSLDQLLQVVSKSIYDKIKNQVTLS